MHYYQNLQKVCEEKNTSPSAILKKIGLSTNKVSLWKNGSTPKLEIAYLIAEELDEPLERFVNDDWQPAAEDPEQVELVNCYQQLNRSGRIQLMGRAYELIDIQEEKKDTSSKSKSEDIGNNNATNVSVPAVSSIESK